MLTRTLALTLTRTLAHLTDCFMFEVKRDRQRSEIITLKML
jgi:hypothetical protein